MIVLKKRLIFCNNTPSHVLSFHHLISYFLIDVISVTPSDTILPIQLQKYLTSKYERIYMLPSLHCKKQLKKNVAYRENPLCLISGWES